MTPSFWNSAAASLAALDPARAEDEVRTELRQRLRHLAADAAAAAGDDRGLSSQVEQLAYVHVVMSSNRGETRSGSSAICDAIAMATTEIPSTADYAEARAAYRSFMDEHIFPNEGRLDLESDESLALVEELRAKAKAEGLWAPHLPPEAGGTGKGFLDYAYLNEEIGRSIFAQLIFGCQAPDAGNGEILHLFGTEEQKERWLKPLVDGEIRSFFSMTEPDVSGADPTGLQTTAVLDGDEWVINGHKWFPPAPTAPRSES